MVGVDRNSVNEGGGDRLVSKLRAKIVRLERKLLQEKDRYDLLQSESDFAKLAASQEAEKYNRECVCLRESVARLKEDCSTFRERAAKDQEWISSLLEEMESKEKEFRERLVELKVEIRCLESGKRRAKDEVGVWMEKYGEAEGWVLRLFDENRRLEGKEKATVENVETRIVKLEEECFLLKENACEVDEEMPERKCRLVVADRGSEGSGSDVEDRIPPNKKRCVEVSSGAKKDPGSSTESSVLLRLRRFSGAKETSAEVADTKFPLVQANDIEEVADETVLAYWKKAYLKNASHKRNVANQTSQRLYTGRIASSKQLAHALKKAETLQCNLKSCNPSFIKPMVRSQVSGGFWLGLPRKFCTKNLPTHDLEIILEDERDVEHKVKYLGGKTGLSGGWRGFALDHTLEIGDALLFELTKPTRFKVYIVKAIQDKSIKKIAGGHTNYSNNNNQRVMDMKNRR